MQSFEWREFSSVDFHQLGKTREQYHHAVQAVSLVGRRFLPEGTAQRSTLVWVPGLFRLAGAWVTANSTFRSSIGFDSFSFFLVDEKINLLASLDLNDKTYLQGLLWLEEHIARQGLKLTNLQMKLPYELPAYPTASGAAFDVNPEMALELGKYYHNSYISMRELKLKLQLDTSIITWPKDFDQALTFVIKDSGEPETSTRLALGMSPGDKNFDRPYFYVSTWPFVDVNECPSLSNGATWFSDEWTGAVLTADKLFGRNQKATLDQFYQEATDLLVKMLTD